jgi:hypothetical protein
MLLTLLAEKNENRAVSGPSSRLRVTRAKPNRCFQICVAPWHRALECPLWVISGHVGLHEKASALPLKADVATRYDKLAADYLPFVHSPVATRL